MSKLYLSRIQLHPGAERTPAFWEQPRLGDAHHRLVWEFFRKDAQGRDFLYRADQAGAGVVFYTLSRRPPSDASGLWDTSQVKLFAPRLRPGQRLAFLLRANAVRRAPAAPPGTVLARPDGKLSYRSDTKHDVVMLERKRLQGLGQSAPPEADLVQQQGSTWLERQGAASGFTVNHVRADGYQQHRLWRRQEKPATFSTIEFSGVLTVTEPATMVERLWAGAQPGLGSARGFGCGLMLVRPVRSVSDEDEQTEGEGDEEEDEG